MSETTTQSEERTTLVYDDDGLGRPPWAMSSPMLKEYYDTEWGLPIFDEAGLYERLSLESFQSGLSWAVVLKKREAFRAAFCNFDPDKVAQFGEADVERLLGDASIILTPTLDSGPLKWSDITPDNAAESAASTRCCSPTASPSTSARSSRRRAWT